MTNCSLRGYNATQLQGESSWIIFLHSPLATVHMRTVLSIDVETIKSALELQTKSWMVEQFYKQCNFYQ
jgi:hypothetical protein